MNVQRNTLTTAKDIPKVVGYYGEIGRWSRSGHVSSFLQIASSSVQRAPSRAWRPWSRAASRPRFAAIRPLAAAATDGGRPELSLPGAG